MRVRRVRPNVSFVMHDDESFWSDQPGQLWIHGLWSVRGLPPHIGIENIYLRLLAPAWRDSFPFVRFSQRVRAIESSRVSRRHSGDGSIEADFVLAARMRHARRLNVSVTFVDHVGRRYQTRCAFDWRGAEGIARTRAVWPNIGESVTVPD
jgi:hypothetical protein